MKEEWKDINGYNGAYQVSSAGRVRSLNKNYGKKRDEPKILKPYKNNCGYLRVWLCKNGNGKNKFIHRLVAEAFVANKDNKEIVNHLNGVKSDNNYDNLEWCTRSENQKHAFKIGIQESVKGSDQGSSKLTEDDVISIRNLYKTGLYTQAEIGKEYGVVHTVISRIVNRKIWKHI